MEEKDLRSLSSLLCPGYFLNCEVQLKTPNIQKTFYVFRINSYRTITGFTLHPINFRDENSPNEWQIHTIIPEKVYFNDFKDIEDLPEPIKDYQEKFFKMACNQPIIYGDGGYAELIYPIYFCEKLQISTITNNTLIRKLEKIGEINKDWHKECPVLDIIDPDLGPNYYFTNKKEGLSERNKYAWFPVDVTVTPEKDVKFHGPIHNLEINENKKLYHGISQVFKAMIPGFEKLGIINPNGSTDLQVVVKSQKYLIQPGTSYAGKWHVEGKTENIIAAGVYYCKIDEGFDQDSVVFKPKVGPDEFYASDQKIETEQEVLIKENCTMVFSNILPHKFLKLTNLTSAPLSRLFLNFFIVDPKHKLESTTSRFISYSILCKLKKFPKTIIDEILSYIYYKTSIFESKLLREKVRESMKTEISGWGYVNYGNIGDIEFIDEKAELDRFDEIVEN